MLHRLGDFFLPIITIILTLKILHPSPQSLNNPFKKIKNTAKKNQKKIKKISNSQNFPPILPPNVAKSLVHNAKI